MTPTGNHATRRPARRRLRRPAIIAALVGLVLGLAAPAYSYWTAATMGSHAGTAAGTLPTPHLTAAPPDPDKCRALLEPPFRRDRL